MDQSCQNISFRVSLGSGSQGTSSLEIAGSLRNVSAIIQVEGQKFFELKITDLINFPQGIMDFHR